MTHTYAILEISESAYKEIRGKLEEAEYQEQLHEDIIDMHGIAIKQEKGAESGLQPYQERVVAEKNRLQERLDKLVYFGGTNIYDLLPQGEQARLHRQLLIMQLYLQVLEERIAAWKK